MAAERRFHVMGTTAHVVAVGGGGWLLDAAERRLADLEDKWSRFRPTSELSRLNAANGKPVVVSPETCDVVALAVDAWFLTGGRFDPTVLPALVAAGYDRSFDELTSGAAVPPVPAPGCRGIEVSRATNTVVLPPGVGLDLGGIGKGRAADLLVDELLGIGAAGACVNIGGDLRATGDAPTGDGWVVTVEHPLRAHDELIRLALSDGAVATTTRAKRTWARADGSLQHHLIDPVTGAPSATRTVSATVLADEAWRAEVLAKAAFIGGAAELTCPGVVVGDDGTATFVDLEAFVV